MRVCDCDRSCMLTRQECARGRIKCRYKHGTVQPKPGQPHGDRRHSERRSQANTPRSEMEPNRRKNAGRRKDDLL